MERMRIGYCEYIIKYESGVVVYDDMGKFIRPASLEEWECQKAKGKDVEIGCVWRVEN